MVGQKSKNNPENRGKANANHCGICDTPKKPILIVGDGKRTMCKECNCGAFDKNGKLVRK